MLQTSKLALQKATEMGILAIDKRQRVSKWVALQALAHHKHCRLVEGYIMGSRLLRLATKTFAGWRLLNQRMHCSKSIFYQIVTRFLLTVFKSWRYKAAGSLRSC